MNPKIPIFPLNLVMYPGALYPLHIFEERYKKLINWCRKENEGFGIISKIDSEISTVGCYVELVEVYNIFDNGSMDILVKGIERFQTKSTELHPEGYIEADVVMYGDAESLIFDDPLVGKTVEKFKDVLDRTEIDLDGKYWKRFEEANLKSYKIAEKSGLNLKQQQSLLSLRSEKDRLKYLFDHFERIEEFLDKSETMKSIIAGDGYIN